MKSGADQFDLLDWPALKRAADLANERAAIHERMMTMRPGSRRRLALIKILNRLTREELSLRLTIGPERRK